MRSTSRLFPPLMLLPLPLLLLLRTVKQEAPLRVEHTLAPGVVYIQEIIPPPNGPLACHLLRVNLKVKGVSIRSEIGRDVVFTDEPAKGRETVGEMALRHKALAAVNTDFFPFTGDPLGIAIRDGELLSEGMPNRAAVGITADGRILFDTLLPIGTLYSAKGDYRALDGINRVPGKDEVIAMTPSFGTAPIVPEKSVCVTLHGVNLPVKAGQEQKGIAGSPQDADVGMQILPGQVVLAGEGAGAKWLREHIREGDTIRFRFDFVANPLNGDAQRGEYSSRAERLRGRAFRSVWTDVAQAAGGGPWLIRDGKIAVDGEAQGFDRETFVLRRHPRTAVGVTEAGELLLVVVDGRQSFSRGMSLLELADYMKRIGAVQAINLDGGGSSTLFVRGLYLNGPSDGSPRPVSNALLIFAEKTDEMPQMVIREKTAFKAGERVKLSLPESEGEDTRTMWGTVEGRAFVDQRGTLTTTRAGSGTVIAVRNGSRLVYPYQVHPVEPAALRASWIPVANNPPDRSGVAVVVVDRFGNPVPGQEVRLQVVGGTADRSLLTTDLRGRAQAEIVWELEGMERRVRVSSGTLPPISLTPTRK
jgi:hypothetical protein